MSSQRFPGKSLEKLKGKPLLGWTVDRVRSAMGVEDLVVATSCETSDDPIESYCREHSLKCFRGSLNNVASRFVKVAQSENMDSFMRISGDSPLIDPTVIDYAISLYRQFPCDLVTNIGLRTFPKGQSVEILSAEPFFKMFQNIIEDNDREHVTKPYYTTPENYRIIAFTSGENAGSVQLSVDSLEDFHMIGKIIDYTHGRPGGWRELVDIREKLSV